MGQKDFTDWGGQKRKQLLYPPKEKPVSKFVRPKREKPVGIKTKADRYRALLCELKRYREWRADSRKRAREHPERYTRATTVPWRPHWEESIARTIKSLRKMKVEYKEEGCWEKVYKILAA